MITPQEIRQRAKDLIAGKCSLEDADNCRIMAIDYHYTLGERHREIFEQLDALDREQKELEAAWNDLDEAKRKRVEDDIYNRMNAQAIRRDRERAYGGSDYEGSILGGYR